MPPPFTVRSGNDPGADRGSWDSTGSITIPGNLTVGGKVTGSNIGGVQVVSVTAADGTITVAGTATAPTVQVNAIAESQVTNLTTDLGTLTTNLANLTTTVAAKAPLANPTFTGTTTTARLVVAPVALTYAATVTPDASTGNLFRVTLTGALTLANPTNAADGQKIVFELIQDATGSRVVTLGAGFAFGAAPTAFTATTTASKRDFLGVIYNSAAAKFFVVAIAQGY